MVLAYQAPEELKKESDGQEIETVPVIKTPEVTTVPVIVAVSG